LCRSAQFLPVASARVRGFTSDCANQIEALTYAYFLAKDLWTTLRAPTCVRVRAPDGAWREARVFGVDDLL
jgi:hypothetical protein